LQTSEGYYETKADMLHKSQVKEVPSLTRGQLFGEPGSMLGSSSRRNRNTGSDTWEGSSL